MADTKISGLTTAPSLNGAELAVVVKGGVTQQTTTQDIADLAGGSNLGNANLTADANRTYTLNGSLATDTLKIKTGAAADIVQFRGDGTAYFLNNVSSGIAPSANFRFYASDTGKLGGFYSVGSGTRGYYAAGTQGKCFEAENTGNGVSFFGSNTKTSGNKFCAQFSSSNAGVNKALILSASGGSINYAFEIISGDFNLADTTNGHKFGTTTSQKMGFWNTTPIVQPTALTTADATATDGTIGTADTIINNLRVRLNELEAKLSTAGGGSGLIA